jgi:SAM-dependent methyltransferase
MMTALNYCIRDDYVCNPNPRVKGPTEGPPYWNERRIKLSGRHQWAVYQHARMLAERNELKRVLDVGCGCATKLEKLFGDGFEAVGADVEEAVEVCRRLGRRGRFEAIDLSVDDPEQLSQFEKKFDLVICSDVIEHLEDPDILMRFLRRVSTEQTTIVLSTPDRIALVGPNGLHSTNVEHIREWSPSEFLRYCESSGLDVLEEHRLLPFSFRADQMTGKFIFRQLSAGRSLKSTQMVVCRLA